MAPVPEIPTRLTALLGCRYPIVQTGMGWVSGPRLTAATCNAGGFGILASATMGFEELVAAIAEVKQRTAGPFGVNLRADQADVLKQLLAGVEAPEHRGGTAVGARAWRGRGAKGAAARRRPPAGGALRRRLRELRLRAPKHRSLCSLTL